MASPVRVLHVVVNMNRGGAETLLMNLYRHIDRSNVQFDFLTCKSGVYDAEIESLGGCIHRIPYITEAGHFGYVKHLKRFFKDHTAYSIVHSHMDKMSGLVLREAKRANIPVRIAHSHNTESEGGILAKMYKSYAGSLIKGSATGLYACSSSAASWLYGKDCNKSIILNNGIEIDKFTFSSKARNEMRSALGLNKEAFVLGHVGRFSRQKNHFYLLDIFAEISEKQSNAVLILVGDGPLRRKIKERIVQLNLGEKVKLLGVREDIPQLMQAFDMFVFPSLHEGLPVTLIEAQSAGLVCLISDHITAEVDLSIGLMHQLPLNDKSMWVNQVIEQMQIKETRKVDLNMVYKKGYDIRHTAKQTEHTYTALKEQFT
ncbi:glycosyltransferase family 1 protein [Virgibacillus sp. W0430]|uniref:glycosyltransferase family 1 protein n=1 Tax=Virgibacillus sp. W0430 TaxID=3391580 RepID=UPI003F458EE0